MSAPLTDDRYLGQHIASFSDDANAQLDLLAPMFGAALSHECRCLFIADHTPRDAFVRGLASRGCDVEPALQAEQFVFITSGETYLKGGYFHPDRQLALWDDAMADARRAGFAGLCASGEVTWLSRAVPGVERWLEYEFRLNSIEGRDSVGLVCLYREDGLPDWAKTELLKSHPLIHRNGRLKPSDAFITGDGHIADVPLLEDLEPPADQLSCQMLAALLSAHADGELHPRRRTEIEGHLRHCPDCRGATDGLGQLKGALSRLRLPTAAPDGFWDGLRARLDRDLDVN